MNTSSCNIHRHEFEPITLPFELDLENTPVVGNFDSSNKLVNSKYALVNSNELANYIYTLVK